MRGKILSLFLTAVIVISGFGNAADRYAVHSIRPVESYLPATGSGEWDMSGSAACSSDIDVKVLSIGDSLIEVSMPAMRYLFSLKGDTLSRLITENRFMRLCDSIPMPVATPVRMEAVTLPAVQTGMAYHHDFIVSEGTVSLMPDEAGTLILSDGDTIRGVVMRHVIERHITAVSPEHPRPLAATPDSLRQTRYCESFTWLRPGLPFPLARTEICRDSIGPRQTGERTETWVLADPVTADVPPRAMVAKAPGQPLDCLSGSGQDAYNLLLSLSGAGRTRKLDNLLSGACISETADGISIAFPPGSDFSDMPGDSAGAGRGTVLLTDILGRVYASSAISPSMTVSLPHPQLPPGEYLLCLSVPSGSAVRKIILH